MGHKNLLALAAARALFVCLSVAPQFVAAQAKTAKPLDVAFVYVSPVSDTGWTAQHDAGRKQLQANLGTAVTTSFVDKVAEGADAERVIRDLAVQGKQLIFTTSFCFMDPTLKVAKEFPKTTFVHVSGYKTAPNVANVNARFYESRYVAGWLAGKYSKSGTAGYVAAFPIPEVLQGVNAFTLGMQSANPKAQVKLVWTNSWFDPGRETEAANTLIAQGADVLTHHTDSNAVPLAAEAKKIKVLSYHSDMQSSAPNAQLAATTHQWGVYYTQTAKQVIAGTWKTGSLWGGAKEGMIRVEGFGKAVSKADQAAVLSKLKAIADGKLHPFTGKITDNAGKVHQDKGVMSDAALSDMNYLVARVVGSVPK